MKKVITKASEESSFVYEQLEELVRMRIQDFIQELLEEEVQAFLGRGRHERIKNIDDTSGYRNGHGKPRRISLKTGTVVVKRPRIRNTEEKFESRVLPLFTRRTKEVGELLPELYLHGLAQGDFELGLRGLLGDGAPLSAASIGRLKDKWEAQFRQWKEEDLSDLEVVYTWADGIYVKAGIGKDKACLLVVIAALSSGEKRILAVEPGYRESKESWGEVLRGLKNRGLRTPRLIVADGHLGIWAALGDIWPEVSEQRCWNHKIVNVLDAMPKKVRGEAGEYLKNIPYAETKEECEKLRDAFKRRYDKWYPKAVEKLFRDWQRMLSFYDYPAEHWKHIRTTNIVESPFSAVRLRTNAARRFRNVSNATGLIWKVLMVAEKRFRKLNAPHLLKEVYAGIKYNDGKRVQLEEQNRRAA